MEIPSKSEVIGRCGGDEQTERQRSLEKVDRKKSIME